MISIIPIILMMKKTKSAKRRMRRRKLAPYKEGGIQVTVNMTNSRRRRVVRDNKLARTGVQRRQKLLVIGDSQARRAERLDCCIKTYPGQTTEEIVMQHVVQEDVYEVILLMVGTVDALRPVRTVNFQNALEELINMYRTKCGKLFIASLPGKVRYAHVEDYNKTIRNVAKRSGAQYLNLTDEKMEEDGKHFAADALCERIGRLQK